MAQTKSGINIHENEIEDEKSDEKDDFIKV